jgi:hypothetical protein
MREQLYRKSSREMQAQAESSFKKSGFAELARDLRRMKSEARKEAIRMRSAYKSGRSLQPERVFKALTGSSVLSELMRDVQRYGKGGLKPLIQGLISTLGPEGKLLDALIGYTPGKTAGTSKLLSSAIELLRAFGYEVLPPPEEALSEKDKRRADEAAKRWLEQDEKKRKPTRKRKKQPRKGQRTDPPEELPEQRRMPPGRSTEPVTIEDSARRKRRFPANHPIITGKFTRTPNSTNVYEFAYDIEEWDLFVRFMNDSGGPGPLYRYSSVTPEQYLGMYRFRNQGDRTGTGRSFSSPGTFVWGQLRIRGTVAGHQKDYQLVSTTDGSVPRKATLTPQGEAFVPRGPMKGERGEVLRGNKPFQLVRGTPNRGQANGPNRGTPNRGR